jgi:hypothetical protein
MPGEKITTLANLLERIKPDILKSINLIWNTGEEELNDIDNLRNDTLTAYLDRNIFKKRYNKLSTKEKEAALYISEVPSGMALKDIVSELSQEKGWDRKEALRMLKRLFSEFFCIPLKSDTDMILFIPKEFRIQMSRLENIDETLLNHIISEMLPQILDKWRMKEICKTLGISVVGIKKHIAKRISQESSFDNLMVSLHKNEVQDIIKKLNEELELNMFIEGSKTELVIQLRKNGINIINNLNHKPIEHPISSLSKIKRIIDEKELSYKNRGETYPARNTIAFLFYTHEYISDIEDCYNSLSMGLYKEINQESLKEATDILYDLGIVLIEQEDNSNYIKLNPEFYKESSINIEEFITYDTDLAKTYLNLNTADKFLLSFTLENYDPTELEIIEKRYKNRFNPDMLEKSLKKFLQHKLMFLCKNDNDELSITIPRIFRKKITDLLFMDETYTNLKEMINSDTKELYSLIDKKDRTIKDYEYKLTNNQEEIEQLRQEYSDLLLKRHDLDETEIINEKNRLLQENSGLLKANKELRNDLNELRSRVIVYDDNYFDSEGFLNLSHSEKNRDRFTDALLFLLQNIGLSAKLNTDQDGPVIIALAAAPDVAIMVDFKLGDNLDDIIYPFGMHFQTDEYIYNSDLNKYTKVMKLFIANQFPETNSITRLSKKHNVKLVLVEQLIEIFNIHNIMPIPQRELIKLFEVEYDRDIFIKEWQINELNRLISEKKVNILRNLLVYNELYKATDINYDSRDAEGIYNNVKQKFIEKGLEPPNENEIKQALESFSSPLLQMTDRKDKTSNESHFTPLFKPDNLIKQIKFLTQFLDEISDELIIDDL